MNDATAPVSKRPGSKYPGTLLGVLGAACLLVLLLLAPWKNAKESTTQLDLSGPVQPLPPAPTSGYVGSTACRDCHEDIHDSFRRHPMGNSITHVGQASPIEDYQEKNKFTNGGFQYHASTFPADTNNPTAEFHHGESLLDQDGALVFQQEVNIDYTVGSGSRGRSYLIQRGSLLFQSPLTWYVKKGIWDLAPGYRPADHLRFERRVDDDCLSCHAGHINSLASFENQYDPAEPFHELSIGCERCHGPGRKHVEMHLDGSAGKNSLIVNPGKLAPRKRESVCNQCHLAGRWRQPRFGKSFLDFRPGQDLAEAWTVLVSGTGFDEQGEVKFTSHVEQMHSSRCFQASKGSMGCISCHDPHRKPDPRQVTAFYQSRCLNCHEKNGCSEDESTRMARDNSCVHCHMGKTNVNNIAHSSATDHRILKNSSTSLPETKPLTNSQWEFFDKADERLPAWERERAEAIALYVQAMKGKNPQYLEQAKEKLLATTQAASNDVIALQYLGNIYLLEKDYDSAGRCLAAILKLQPTHELGLQMMASVQYQKNNLEAANQYYRQVINLNPWASDRYGPYARSLAQAGDMEGAINALELSLDNNPTNHGLHLYLATLLDISGRNEEAMEHRRFAASLEALVRPEPAGGMSLPATNPLQGRTDR